MARRARHFLVSIALGLGAAMVALLTACSAPPPVATTTASAVTPAAPAAASSTASVATGSATPAAPTAAASVEVTEDMRRKRPVDPAHQRCTGDGDCDAVLADCSNLRCVGVRKEFAKSYAGLDCKGYAGPVGNYDCQPVFHIEAPRCESGKCVSRRIHP